MNKLGQQIIMLLFIFMSAGIIHGKQDTFTKGMKHILSHYISIQETLAAGKTDGTVKKARQIITIAGKINVKRKSPEHTAMEKIHAAGKKLSTAGTQDSRKKAFHNLSKPLAAWVSREKIPGYIVVYCPMEKATWVQKKTTVMNPYNTTMSRCGKIIGGDK